MEEALRAGISFGSSGHASPSVQNDGGLCGAHAHRSSLTGDGEVDVVDLLDARMSVRLAKSVILTMHPLGLSCMMAA
jgi:hypothetical protein